MNPDTAPIEEVEAWLAPRLGWHALPDKPGWYSDGKGLSLIAGVLIGPSIDAAVACLPKGRNYSASAWSGWLSMAQHIYGVQTGRVIHTL